MGANWRRLICVCVCMCVCACIRSEGEGVFGDILGGFIRRCRWRCSLINLARLLT